ncbi:MAG TPA: hypothetical protein VF590_09705 [Isosphaeraceae bacterium]|jgi:hypothetical protein
MQRPRRARCLPPIGLAAALVLAGCHDPEDGRPRGGGPGGDARNYVPGRVRPPSKIDATKDLGLLQHDGPRP